MYDITVIDKKALINGKEYTFRLDFEALMKLEERYENFYELFNDFLQNKKTYGTMLKILSCSCIEKDWTEEELRKTLGFSYPVMHLIDELSYALIVGSILEQKTEDTKNNNEKNE